MGRCPNGDSSKPHLTHLELANSTIPFRMASEITLSRQHAVVRFAQGQFTVQDMGSPGGTYVGGFLQRGATPFGPGTLVVMGQVEMELVL